MNEFTERFKSKSNVELLNILDNPAEFQKLAVEAASSEISDRKLSLAFLCIWTYQLFKNFALIQYIFTSGDSGWDFSLVMFFLPIMYLPLMTFLFWKKKSTGWILLSIYLTYSAINIIGLLIMSINSEPSGIPALDSLFPTTPAVTYVLTLIFYCGTIWTISKEHIRDIFEVTNRTMYMAIGITGGISSLMIISYF